LQSNKKSVCYALDSSVFISVCLLLKLLMCML